MLHIKKFKLYEPSSNAIDGVLYLKSEDEKDWYEIQSQFAKDTLKVMFDDNGLVISCSRDASLLFPVNCGVLEVESETDDLLGCYVVNGNIVKEEKPSEYHEWDGSKWVVSQDKRNELLNSQRAEIRAAINKKRDDCVNGGVFVPKINKWVDTDGKGRSTLVEIKADFDLNGKDNTYTLICADNTAQVIHFEDFKAVWNAVKTLKEKMYENAYMHKLLLEQSANPKDYNWSSGWSKTYQEHLEGK